MCDYVWKTTRVSEVHEHQSKRGIRSHKQHMGAECECVLHWNLISIVGFCCPVVTQSLPTVLFQIKRIPCIFLQV
jgi:hypothetical protein